MTPNRSLQLTAQSAAALWVPSALRAPASTELRRWVIKELQLTENDKLKLIVEATRYCKKVRDLGIPKSCYSKALREPIFFLWEKQSGINKDKSTRFCSLSAGGIRENGGSLVYDHAIPFNYVLERMLAIEDVNSKISKNVLLKI